MHARFVTNIEKYFNAFFYQTVMFNSNLCVVITWIKSYTKIIACATSNGIIRSHKTAKTPVIAGAGKGKSKVANITY